MFTNTYLGPLNLTFVEHGGCGITVIQQLRLTILLVMLNLPQSGQLNVIDEIRKKNTLVNFGKFLRPSSFGIISSH